MANFKITDLTSTVGVTLDSVVPCVQSQASRSLPILRIKQYLNDGTLKSVASGDGFLCNPNPITTSGTVSFFSPGLMALYAGITDPVGWLICDGRPLDPANYQNLFNKIGYTYGNASGFFNIPNLTGRSVAGLDNMGGGNAQRLTQTFTGGSGANVLGSTGGKVHHELIPTETPIAEHSHSLNGKFNTPRITGGRDSGSVINQSTPQEYINTTSGSVNVDLTLKPQNPSSSPLNPAYAEVHHNVPPFILLNYIIKT
jgi:microcystin-dependent protein